jgi:hypothetical protein
MPSRIKELDGPLLPLTQEAGRCGAARKSRHSVRLQKLIKSGGQRRRAKRLFSQRLRLTRSLLFAGNLYSP